MVLPSELQRRLVRLRPAADEVGVGEAAGVAVGDDVGQFLGGGVGEQAGVDVGDAVELRRDGRCDLGVAVAEAGDRRPARAVEDVASLGVAHPHAAPAHGGDGVGVQCPVQQSAHAGHPWLAAGTFLTPRGGDGSKPPPADNPPSERRRVIDDVGRDDKGGAASFEERLRAARTKQGLDTPAEPLASSGVGGTSAMGIGLRVGVELVSAMVVGVGIGWFLDRWLHTSPLLLILFVLLGGGAGVANVWRLMGPKRPPG